MADANDRPADEEESAGVQASRLIQDLIDRKVATATRPLVARLEALDLRLRAVEDELAQRSPPP